jgi:hypothetical protein
MLSIQRGEALTMDTGGTLSPPSMDESSQRGEAPTMDIGGNLSPPSMDENSQPCKLVFDLKVMHDEELQTSDRTWTHDSEPASADESSADGLSNGTRASWISTMMTPEGLSMFTATCTIVNYLSAGYILLPWAFSQGGTLLTSIVLGAVALQTYITASFVLEACARAQALALLETDGSLPKQYSIQIGERKYELSLLTEIFLGKMSSVFFCITTLGDLYGITWALCSIFANAFANEFPLGDTQDGGYKPYIAMFMVVAVPLSCTSVTDQLGIQMIFMMARFVMVILMVGTVAGAYGADEPHFGSQVGPVNDVTLAKPSNIASVTMTCMFATSHQFSAPTMASESRSKTGLTQVFGIATAFSYATNLLLGILLALFFGQDQPDSSNLNWGDYHGGTGEADPAAWARVISGYIVLFAAIDIIAVYSLIAVSTGEILMGAVYGDRVHEVEKDWRIRTAFRLLGSIPPAIGAMVVSDLGVIAKYAGIFTVLSYTVCPSLLALSSRARMKENDLPLTTYYSSIVSSRFWAYGLLLASAVVIVGVVVSELVE